MAHEQAGRDWTGRREVAYGQLPRFQNRIDILVQRESLVDLGGLQVSLGSAPAGSAAHSDSLFPTGVVRPPVNNLVPKSRMREIRTYGSVVGPAR